MRRGLVGVLIATISLTLPGESSAALTHQVEPCRRLERQVILLLAEGMSYEEALRLKMAIVPGGQVGIGLMTVADDRELAKPQASVGLGSGGRSTPLRTRCAAIERDSSSRWMEVHKGLLGRAARVGTADDLLDESDLLVLLDDRWLSTEAAPMAPLLFLLLAYSPAEEVMLIVAAPIPSREMRAKSDEVTPLIIAKGRLTERMCVPLSRCAQGLTSNSTRREGVVSNIDVASTITNFLDIHSPVTKGSPIRIEGDPPTRLHERYLEYQRIHTPVGLLTLAIVLITLFASVGVLLARRSAPPNAVKALGILALVSVALPVVMLPSSLLPRLTYSVVLPTLVAAVSLLAIVAIRLGRGDPAAPVAIVAGLGMGVVILDGVLGWPGMLMPLLGDSALEGVRFYGMGNAYSGVYMAGAILLSARIPPIAGVGLLLATGLLAGLPGFGAELGTSFTLFLAAGLWYLLRVRKRFGLREVATAGAITLAGLATILLIHRFSGVPTHVTRVLEDAERSGAGELLSVFGRRLALNVRNTSATPIAWLIVALLPVWLAVAWNRLGPFGPSLRKNPSWREAAIVLALSSIVAFLVNDSIGVTGLGFTFLSAALIYPALRERWTISG